MTATLREALATQLRKRFGELGPGAHLLKSDLALIREAVAALSPQVPKDQCGNHLDRFPCKACGAAVPIACPRFESDRLAALSAQVPEDDARLLRTLVGLVKSAQPLIPAHPGTIGGKWNEKATQALEAADRIEVLSSGQGRMGE